LAPNDAAKAAGDEEEEEEEEREGKKPKHPASNGKISQ
jgi:hypothetical protein